mmetsp:Transcript_50/g.106  ORF Transcript_50/g.106 Transcript_50/m.106 type:complete len:373 (+) Transcript_50:143-1261(+)
MSGKDNTQPIKKIGFNLKGSKKKKPIQPRILGGEEEVSRVEKKEEVVGFDGGLVQSKEKKGDDFLVIPLSDDQFVIPDGLKKPKEPSFCPSSSRSKEKEFELVESRAPDDESSTKQFGLIVSSKKNDESREDQTSATKAVNRWRDKGKESLSFFHFVVNFSQSFSLDDKPLLLKNRLEILDDIKDEKEKFRVDIQCRPEEPSIEDYTQVPVEKFGEAMLRGMGWAPGAPVGLSNPGVFEPVTFTKRDARLGLGAQTLTKAVSREKKISSSSSKKGEVSMKGEERHRKRKREEHEKRGVEEHASSRRKRTEKEERGREDRNRRDHRSRERLDRSDRDRGRDRDRGDRDRDDRRDSRGGEKDRTRDREYHRSRR